MKHSIDMAEGKVKIGHQGFKSRFEEYKQVK